MCAWKKKSSRISKRYIAYAGRGDFSHVVNNNALPFLKDTGFQSWLAEHRSHYRGHQEEAPYQATTAIESSDTPRCAYRGTVSCGCL